MGINPTFKMGMIGMSGLYDHLPIVSAYFSIITANIKPAIAMATNLFLEFSFGKIRVEIIASISNIRKTISKSPKLARMWTFIRPLIPTKCEAYKNA